MANDEMDIPDKKIDKFKGLHPTHMTIDEMLRMPDEDSPINKARKEFYSGQLPTGYVPPFPTGEGERRLAEMNEVSKDIWPPLEEKIIRWRKDLRRDLEAKIDRRIIFGDKPES